MGTELRMQTPKPVSGPMASSIEEESVQLSHQQPPSHTPSSTVEENVVTAEETLPFPKRARLFATPPILSYIYHTYMALPWYGPLLAPMLAAETEIVQFYCTYPANYVLMICTYIMTGAQLCGLASLHYMIKNVNTPVSQYVFHWPWVKYYLATNYPNYGWIPWWCLVCAFYIGSAPIVFIEWLLGAVLSATFNFFWLPIVSPLVLQVIPLIFMFIVASWAVRMLVSASILLVNSSISLWNFTYSDHDDQVGYISAPQYFVMF
ncbi:hypothetical protein BON22_3180 [Cyberlindnera fabianii]|uniref:Uncharacterized protein n=1 Tax=Cyberlindnera fabianii TaxID=36022 RepID=A0A1V2L5T0_CYBFA|nr:hypothetical protein BON22_3180 [Cyberlindnera fabianii]